MSTKQERDRYDDYAVLNYYVENTGVENHPDTDQETIICTPLSHVAFAVDISEARVRKSIRRWNEWWSARGVEQSLSYRSGVGYFYTEDAKYRRAVIKHQAKVGNGVIRSARTETEQTAKHDPYVLKEVLSEVVQTQKVTARLLALVEQL